MSLDEHRLGLARLRLLASRPYFAVALYRMTPLSVPGLGTAAVDRRWRLAIDPAVADQWSIPEYASVLEHELGHLLRNHADRAAATGVISREDSLRFNLAADAEINDDLLGDGAQLPGSPVSPATLDLPAGQLAEWYYRHLPRDHHPAPDDPACGSGCHGHVDSWEVTPGQSEGIDPVTAAVVRKQVADAVIEHHQRRAGTVGAGLLRWARSLGTPQIDWRQVLRSSIRQRVSWVNGMVDYSRSRPSRRSRAAYPILLHGLRQPHPSIAVVLDTSGSMRQADLDVAVTELAAVIRAAGVPSIHLVSCDTQVTVRRVTSHGLEEVAVTGGGGTDLRVGLNAAIALRPQPDVIVTITDGHTPWPDHPLSSAGFIVCVVADGPPAPAWATTVTVPSASPIDVF